MLYRPIVFLFFFFNDTATTEIYTLSLHDALPILFGAPPIDVVVGAEVHASIRKALSMAGFGRKRVTVVDADSQGRMRSEEHTSELQSRLHLVCRLLLEKKNDFIGTKSHGRQIVRV